MYISCYRQSSKLTSQETAVCFNQEKGQACQMRLVNFDPFCLFLFFKVRWLSLHSGTPLYGHLLNTDTPILRTVLFASTKSKLIHVFKKITRLLRTPQ